MLAPAKLVLMTLGIIIVMLFAVGLVRVKSDGYGCAGGWEVGWHEREEIFHYGPVHLYAIPFKRECPTERRYDPNDVQSCVNTGFCTIRDNDESAEL